MWSKSTVIKLLKLKLVDVYFLVLITVTATGNIPAGNPFGRHVIDQRNKF